ncbi:MAG: PfkB family carbohydrate kinase [Butyricicoccus sp.]
MKLSDDEVEFCTGCKTEREAQSFVFAGLQAAACARGAGGAAVTPNASAETKALPVTVADTTGAGDSFIGSFLYQLTRDGVTAETLADIPQKKLADYLTFSSECSAYTVQHKGAVMPTETELRMKNG